MRARQLADARRWMWPASGQRDLERRKVWVVMMRKWQSAYDGWIFPHAPFDILDEKKERRRRQVSRMVMIVELYLSVLLFVVNPHVLPLHPLLLAEYGAGTILTLAATAALCHFCQTEAAAWLAVLGLAAFALIIALPGFPTFTNVKIVLVVPLIAGGVLLSARACLSLAVGLIGAINLYGFLAMPHLDRFRPLVIQNDLIILSMMAFVVAGSMALSRNLRSVARSEELAEANAHLKESIASSSMFFEQIAALNSELQTTLTESEQTRNELATTFDLVDEGIAVFTPDLREVHLNLACQRLFNITPQPGRSFAEMVQGITMATPDGIVIAPDDLPMLRALSTQAAQPASLLAFHLDGGATIFAQVQAAPLLSAQGDVLGAMTTMHDVTREYHSTRNAEIMRAVAHACASGADESTVAREALDALMRGLSAPTGAIVLRDSQRPGFARIVTSRRSAMSSVADQERITSLLTGAAIAPDAPLATLRVLATGKPQFDHTQALQGTPAITGGDAYAVLGVVPLKFENRIVGSLCIGYDYHDAGNWEPFTCDLLVVVADEIATSLHRAHLYEEARSLAWFDPLTGLHNHRALQGILQREMSDGAAKGLPVSLIMLDLDHFRRYNETYGHESGDRALRAVARVIREALGNGHSAARYGGEEFIVVLPGADASQAHELAEQIRQQVEQVDILADTATRESVHLTISLSHATFPIHASAAASLIKAADLALFSAKRQGRNCTVAYALSLLQDGTRIAPAIVARPRELTEITLPTGADLEAVQALITAIDLRDGYTAAHSQGVSAYSVALAQQFKLPTEHIEALRLGGLIHDVGKIGVPDSILCKPGKLTEEEWVLMRAHTTMGEAIMRPVEQLRHLLPLVRWHHERLDGSGYPDGLRGDEIPFLVRILSVADVFEAFTAERPYHPGRPAIEGLRLLQHEARQGKMDERVVEVFEHLLSMQGFIESVRQGEHEMRDAA